MKLTFCENCGTVFNENYLKFDTWHDDTVPDTAYYDGDQYIPTAPCPVCQSRITLDYMGYRLK